MFNIDFTRGLSHAVRACKGAHFEPIELAIDNCLNCSKLLHEDNLIVPMCEEHLVMMEELVTNLRESRDGCECRVLNEFIEIQFIIMYSDLKRSFDCEQGAIRKIHHNKDGEYLITCGSNKTLKLWNPRKALLLQLFSGHNNEVLDADCSDCSSKICSAGQDRYVIYHDVSTGKPILTYREHIAPVNCVKFNLESTLIITGSVDCTIRLFDCKSRSRQSVQVLNEAKDAISCLKVNDQQIISGSLDGKVRIYDLRKGQLFVEDCQSSVISIAETQDKQCLLVGCLDSKLRLIDKENGQVLSEYTGHSAKKYRIDCAFNRLDSIIISGSEDGRIYYWTLLDSKLLGSQLGTVNNNRPVVHTLSTNLNKDELLTASENCVYLWNKPEND